MADFPVFPNLFDYDLADRTGILQVKYALHAHFHRHASDKAVGRGQWRCIAGQGSGHTQ
jgi:hypothetical protein